MALEVLVVEIAYTCHCLDLFGDGYFILGIHGCGKHALELYVVSFAPELFVNIFYADRQLVRAVRLEDSLDVSVIVACLLAFLLVTRQEGTAFAEILV